MELIPEEGQRIELEQEPWTHSREEMDKRVAVTKAIFYGVLALCAACAALTIHQTTPRSATAMSDAGNPIAKR